MRTGARTHARTLGARARVRRAVRVRVMQTQRTRAHTCGSCGRPSCGAVHRYRRTCTARSMCEYQYGLCTCPTYKPTPCYQIAHQSQSIESKHDSLYIYISIYLPMRACIHLKICAVKKDCVLMECQWVSMYMRACESVGAHTHAHTRLRTRLRPHARTHTRCAAPVASVCERASVCARQRAPMPTCGLFQRGHMIH